RVAGSGGGRGAVPPFARPLPGRAGGTAPAAAARNAQPQHRPELSARIHPPSALALGKLLGAGRHLAQRSAPVPALPPCALRAGARALSYRAPEPLGAILGAGGQALPRLSRRR